MSEIFNWLFKSDLTVLDSIIIALVGGAIGGVFATAIISIILKFFKLLKHITTNILNSLLLKYKILLKNYKSYKKLKYYLNKNIKINYNDNSINKNLLTSLIWRIHKNNATWIERKIYKIHKDDLDIFFKDYMENNKYLITNMLETVNEQQFKSISIFNNYQRTK